MTIDIRDIAKTIHEWTGYRYIAFERVPSINKIRICLSKEKMFYFGQAEKWEYEHQFVIPCEVQDFTGEYSTNGEIDFSKCLFDFGESR